MSEPDQALVPTDHCLKWGCDNVFLVEGKYGFWNCPKCGVSYGKDAKEGLEQKNPHRGDANG